MVWSKGSKRWNFQPSWLYPPFVDSYQKLATLFYGRLSAPPSPIQGLLYHCKTYELNFIVLYLKIEVPLACLNFSRGALPPSRRYGRGSTIPHFKRHPFYPYFYRWWDIPRALCWHIFTAKMIFKNFRNSQVLHIFKKICVHTKTIKYVSSRNKFQEKSWIVCNYIWLSARLHS